MYPTIGNHPENIFHTIQCRVTAKYSCLCTPYRYQMMISDINPVKRKCRRVEEIFVISCTPRYNAWHVANDIPAVFSRIFIHFVLFISIQFSQVSSQWSNWKYTRIGLYNCLKTNRQYFILPRYANTLTWNRFSANQVAGFLISYVPKTCTVPAPTRIYVWK